MELEEARQPTQMQKMLMKLKEHPLIPAGTSLPYFWLLFEGYLNLVYLNPAICCMAINFATNNN